MITCLGRTFPDDDTRRAHFRDELRRQLPELKKIEGFPIGEDEDIIALSDPPYYTACPNPWLDDFIAEWEAAKEGVPGRKPDFDVQQPYAADVSEGKSNPVYTAHTYHTKVPHPAIMRFLLHYTQPGDIVLDAFAGTGMTGVAAQVCENPDLETKIIIESEWKQMFGVKPTWGARKAICGDLSPYASLISYNYNTPVDIEIFYDEAKKLFEQVKKECLWLYQTQHTNGGIGTINYTLWSDILICPNCAQEIVFWEAAVNQETKEVYDDFECINCGTETNSKKSEKKFETYFDNSTGEVSKRVSCVPVLIVYSYSKKRFIKKPDKEDIHLIQRIQDVVVDVWHPLYELPDGFNTRQPMESHSILKVHQFFTRRNLLALAILNQKIINSNESNKLRFILTGLINRLTVMNRIHLKNFFFGGGGWNVGHLKGTLYVPALPIETSILELIEDKISSFVKAAKYLSKNHNCALYVASATELFIKDNSIDYVFTDPPFGANIMYSELNFLTESWIRVITNNNKEAIENRVQSKKLLDYQAIMTECFKEYFRVLKPGRWMTVEFSNTKAAVWNGIQTAIQRAGFIIANIASLDKKQGGMRGIISPSAVKQDLAISCYKPSEQFEAAFAEHPVEVAIWDFVREHLQHLPVHTQREGQTANIVERDPRILYDRLITFYLMRGLPVPIDSSDFRAGLRQRFTEIDGQYFLPEQGQEYSDKKAQTSGMVQASLFIGTENEGIAWLQEALKTPKTYQDLHPSWMKSITAVRKGDVLPELSELLADNFIQLPSGAWRVPDPNEAKDREALRNKALLKEFARYVSTLQDGKTKRLKEVRTEALQAGFRDCWERKDFGTVVLVGDRIPSNLLLEDEKLLMYYDIAKDRV